MGEKNRLPLVGKKYTKIWKKYEYFIIALKKGTRKEQYVEV
jgi:hypothetical protein